MPPITPIVPQNCHHIDEKQSHQPILNTTTSFFFSPFNRTRKTLNMAERSHPSSRGGFALQLREKERLDPQKRTRLISSSPFSRLTCAKILQGGENGEAPPEQGGFMGGIMGKANALKAKAAETAAAAGAGNLQVSQPRSLLTSLYSLEFPRSTFPPVVSVLGSTPSWTSRRWTLRRKIIFGDFSK